MRLNSMNEFRAAIRKGEVAKQTVSPIVAKEQCRRDKVEATLAKVLIPRVERRTTNQRREDRYRGIVDRASVVFRRKRVLVKVVNMSESGMMIEAPIEPRIGEQLRVEFEGFEPLSGVVCWARDGRLGLDLGDGAISLG
jgi:hypothetical protein